MSSRMKQAAMVVAAAAVAAQLVRPSRVNPPIDPVRTIEAHVGTRSALAAVLDRACRDCHSNRTVWPRAAAIAPLSWVMASAIAEGRRAVNFSEWGGYPQEVRRALLLASCADASSGKMPGVYTLVRPESRLSPQDIETICAAARPPGVQTRAAGSR